MMPPQESDENLDPRLDYSFAASELERLERVGVRDLPTWVDEHFLTHDPFAFKGRDFKDFRTFSAAALSIEHHNIWCTGSGALGFSLNPNKFSHSNSSPKRFDVESDLDISIISTHHFDVAWKELRERFYSYSNDPGPEFNKKISAQRKKIFDGAIRTDMLLEDLSISTQWVPALRSMESWVADRFNRNTDVNFWIYRDIWSARNYVANGARQLKGQLS